MKRYIKENFNYLNDSTDNTESEFVLTPSALLDLLSSVDEFKDFNVNIIETLDHKLQLQVNDSYYDLISDSDITTVEIDPEAVNQISEVNEDTYQELIDTSDITTENIESGIIKEALKTLAIGGIVRLGKKYLLGN